MDRDRVPLWMVMLVGFFSIASLAAFIWFLHSYTQAASMQEQQVAAEQRVKDLREASGKLEARLAAYGPRIESRRIKITDLDRSDEDEQLAVTTSLTPRIKATLTKVQQANAQKIARLERLLKSGEDARAELRVNEEQRYEAETTGEDERNRLRVQIEDLSVAMEATRREQLDKLLEREAVLKLRRTRVQELLDRRDTKVEELISDGQILEAQVTNGFVIINRGLYDDIRFGMKFVVFNRLGGKKTIKGEIEVIEVEPRIAVARVIAERDLNNPLIPGDHIHNSIYHPDEVKVYVLAGNFERYSQPELKRLIEDAGGRVDRTVGPATHYLVAGMTGADEELAVASANGVTVLSEAQLLEGIRRTERYEIRRGMTFALAGKFTTVDRGVIERFIKDNGGIIESKVGSGVDVLITGEGAEKEISQAYLVGATIMNQNQLVSLMSNRGQR